MVTIITEPERSTIHQVARTILLIIFKKPDVSRRWPSSEHLKRCSTPLWASLENTANGRFPHAELFAGRWKRRQMCGIAAITRPIRIFGKDVHSGREATSLGFFRLQSVSVPCLELALWIDAADYYDVRFLKTCCALRANLGADATGSIYYVHLHASVTKYEEADALDSSDNCSSTSLPPCSQRCIIFGPMRGQIRHFRLLGFFTDMSRAGLCQLRTRR